MLASLVRDCSLSVETVARKEGMREAEFKARTGMRWGVAYLARKPFGPHVSTNGPYGPLAAGYFGAGKGACPLVATNTLSNTRCFNIYINDLYDVYYINCLALVYPFVVV